MEIIGTNQDEQERKTKKTMKMIIIAIVILLIISIILGITINELKKQQFKFYVDGNLTDQTAKDLFVYQDNKVYISIKDIASIINYNYYDGGYKQYNEDPNKCYLECENEIVTFEKDSTTIYKTPVDVLDYEYFTIKEKVQKINNKLYIDSEGLQLACNLKFSYEPEKNKITIYTLPYYASCFVETDTKCAVDGNFKNQKALMYDLMVVQNIDNTEKTYNAKDMRYGISLINGDEMIEIVGTKYTNIEFIESTQEFIVTTTENKVGIISADGDTKVKPQYDSLKQIDKNLNLYLATSNNKKGVIEKNGKILIYLEYDEIGVDTSKFINSNITNQYLLFNNLIPVKQNGKWGLFDKKGTLVTKIEYDGIGCATNNNNSNNVLIIPDVKGIVVSKIREDENRKKITEYGILNYLGREMIPVTLSTVNCEVENGREKYSMTYQGTTYDVIEYFNQWIDLETLNDENKNINEVNANSNTTTTTTTNTTTNNTTTVNTTNTQMTSNQI